MRCSTPRFSFFHILFDICYLALLCGIILITFYYVFLPAQPAMTSLYHQSLPVFRHTGLPLLPTEFTMLCAIGSLVYLKCIWRLICR